MLLSVPLLLGLFSCTRGENPAIQVSLSNKGLQYGKHTATDWIQENLERVTFPEISGDVEIGFLGSIDYTLSDITIKKCDLPEPSVEFYPDAQGFKTSVQDLSIALSGGWSTHYGVIHDGGSFDMAVFDVYVVSVLELGKDPDGHLSVSSASCDAKVGDVDMQFSGGASWIFQPFVKHFKGRIRSKIESSICPSVDDLIGNLEAHLQSMNVSFDTDWVLTLDLPLTGVPVISASSLNLGLKGEFYNIDTHKEPPFEAQPFTMSEQQSYMLCLGVSDFTVNSALFGYYSAGLFQGVINDSMVFQYTHMHLNTTTIGSFIPQLPHLFPDLLMSLMVYARQLPTLSFQRDSVKMLFQGSVKAFALQPNGTQTPLFTLDFDSNFSGKMRISEERLTGSVQMDNFTLTLVASEVGTFKTDTLEKAVKIGMQFTVLKEVNAQLAQGFPLPRMKQVQLVNSVLNMEEGFIAVSSDAKVVLTD